LVGSARAFLKQLARELEQRGAPVRVLSQRPTEPLRNGAWLVFAAAPAALDPIGLSAVPELSKLIQGLEGETPALHVVTFGAQRVLAEDRPAPAQNALSGLARVLMTERPELMVRLVDLSSAPDGEVALTAELFHGAELEEETAIRA